ncbi:MAG: hypothetical protein PWQ48_1645 [Thermotogaceae bacterium]|jgi:long-subunit fatty acid transport protein|nr:hypothetical protein [Thermotogaceae bacterium]
MMKKFLVLFLVLLTVAVLGLSQRINITGDIGYTVGIKTDITQDSSPVATNVSLSLVEGGVTFSYEVVEDFAIGARVGFAYAPIEATDIQLIYDSASATTFMPLDIMVVASYKYAFDGFGIGVTAGGGLSTPDFFSHFGWVVKTTIGGFYSFGNFRVTLGAGIEMRNYSVGEGRTLNFIGVPISLEFNYSF